MIFDSQDMMWIALQVILAHFVPFTQFLAQKIKKFLKKKKQTWIYHYFTPESQNSQSFDVYFLKNDADSIAGYSWPSFALLFPFLAQN